MRYAAGHTLCNRMQCYTRTQTAQVGTAESWELLPDPEDALCMPMLFIRLNSVPF